ncbi:MAG: flagellar biosynthesis protein FlhA [Nitrospiraceae bacterium]|nr:flagellar biosynthesis protein FlhA [Nitrospiraceae bacterium]
MAVPLEQTQPQSRWSLRENQDIVLAFFVIGILVVLVIPLPTWILDTLLTVNISLSVVLLLGTIYLQRPTDFSVFPSLLLVLTLFRLSLNVASTRLILAEANAGKVIQAFGSFVTSGNFVVGFVVFVILVVIQFVVITRGAQRISEVAARFTLDAMPGKQMGVDADLNAGLITEAEARTRRRDIEQEADFYGAMDGATRFVRGDAIAGLIITLVNVIGGFVIGILMRGMEFTDALRVYTQLTIGDGLVTQVPALVISTSAGLIVTRTATQENMGADFGRQLSQYPRALAVAAILLVIFALAPGMPKIPFIVASLLLFVGAYKSKQSLERKRAVALATELAGEEVAAVPPRTEDLLTVDPLKIELGFGLIPMADPKQGDDLLSRIQIIRQQMATKMGFVVPVVRIIDNMRLRPNEYCVKLREAVIASYELLPDYFLAMNPGLAEEEIEGVPTTEPTFGLPAIWVSPANRDRAQNLGYTIVEPPAVLATHLTELILSHADELLTREDVQRLVKHVQDTSPSVVEELLPNLLTLGELQKVLHNLLRERVSIRNLEAILETLADYAPRTRDAELLTEYARHRLAREITSQFVDEEGKLHVVTVDSAIEQEILDALQRSETGEHIPLAPQRATAIAQAAIEAVQPMVMMGHEPLVLTSAPVRRYVKRMIERQQPKVMVLSYNEVDPAAQLESEGQVGA